MKAEGRILQPVYDASDVNCKKILHYTSYLKVIVSGRQYEHSYDTPVHIFDGLQKDKPANKKQYTDWLESYLKRCVGTAILNDGAEFTYA